MAEPSGEEVAAALGLGERHRVWLAELGAVAPAEETRLPEADEAAFLLRRLACPEQVVADAVASLFTSALDPYRFWLLARCRRWLLETMGDPAAPRWRWPQLPAALGSAGGCFPIHVFLATLDDTRSFHAACGVADEVSWATLADLGRHAAIALRNTGRSGVDEPWWMTLHLRGVLFELGRLQYTRFQLGVGPEHPEPWLAEDEARRLGEGFRTGDPALGVHIPGGSPLEPAHCEQSMQAARRFFDRHFPVPTRRLATCASWLLDDQLAAMLPASSNILAFQRSFQLVGDWREADEDVCYFVFGDRRPRLDALPRRTTLERAVVAQLEAGGHMHSRTGWRDLPEPA